MMRRLTLGLLATGLLTTAASAADMPSPAVFGSMGYSENVRTYPFSRNNSPKTVLERLDRLCASKRRSDQQQCEQAWRAINAAYAELQTKRAAAAGAVKD
jgi:predicted lipoprotein